MFIWMKFDISFNLGTNLLEVKTMRKYLVIPKSQTLEEKTDEKANKKIRIDI